VKGSQSIRSNTATITTSLREANLFDPAIASFRRDLISEAAPSPDQNFLIIFVQLS
jgi:hypothetical protein